MISTWHKFMYKKKVVGTNLAWKQICQIYLRVTKARNAPWRWVVQCRQAP